MRKDIIIAQQMAAALVATMLEPPPDVERVEPMMAPPVDEMALLRTPRNDWRHRRTRQRSLSLKDGYWGAELVTKAEANRQRNEREAAAKAKRKRAEAKKARRR